jgi:hypothetical protein
MKTLNTYQKIKLIYWYLMLPGILCTLGGCKKFVEIAPPVSQIENSVVFADDQASVSAALGVYANMGLSNLYICSGGSTLYPALSADELVYTSSNTELLSFQNNAVIADNGTGIYTRLWVPAYKNIYNANAVLEGVTQSTSLTDSVRKQLKGEMLVVRALNYFYLVNMFGDVTLELSTDYLANEKMPRTPSDQVYTRLITDMQEAQILLPETYASGQEARPNKWTATALLARLYLYKKDWTNSVTQSSAVINSNRYTLETDLNNVFLNTSNEVIWQLANDYHNTAEGVTFIPSSATSRPSYALNTYLLAAFETNDQRKVKWLKKNTNGGKDYYYPYKYKNRLSTPITEYEVILRLAEQYLIRAEARARLNDISGALADLNIIRARAGLGNSPANDQQSLLTAIAGERQTELFCEWGHRFFDLKRTGKADAVLGVNKAPNWQSSDGLYPLPLSELQNNPFLVQNAGY